MKLILLSSLFFLTFTIGSSLVAQNVPSIVTDGSHLSGSRLKQEDLITKADCIFIGHILKLSPPSYQETGNEIVGAHVEVDQLLKGMINSPINVRVKITYLKGIEEKRPQMNHSYIFYVKINKEDSIIEALKIVDGTSEAIKHAQAIIAK